MLHLKVQNNPPPQKKKTRADWAAVKMTWGLETSTFWPPQSCFQNRPVHIYSHTSSFQNIHFFILEGKWEGKWEREWYAPHPPKPLGSNTAPVITIKNPIRNNKEALREFEYYTLQVCCLGFQICDYTYIKKP